METMRDDFEAAMTELDIEISEPTQEILNDEEETEETPADDTSEPVQDAEETGGEPAPIAASGEGEEHTEAPSKPEPTNLKAPVDWSPSERESWSKIPKNFQEKILNREKDIASTLQETATARRTHDHLTKLAQSYAPVIAAEGAANPMEAIEGLFQTVSKLRMGSNGDKAQAMAGLIKHYGVDINDLDNALVGQSPNQNTQQNDQLEQMLNQRMAPVNQLMQQLEQQQTNQQQQQKSSADNAVAQFSDSAEFISDVRYDMADLIDMAAKRGQDLTLQQAYDKACSLHPEISGVLEQRKAQEAIMGGNNSMAAKRTAASSISGRKGGTSSGNAHMSMRDQIADAWNTQNG